MPLRSSRQYGSIAAALIVSVLLPVRALAQTPSPIERLLPGSALLTAPKTADESQVWQVSRRKGGDTTETRFGQVTRTAHPAAERGVLQITSTWAPPFSSIDTATIALHDLSPVAEMLSYGGAVRRYQYHGRVVTGTVVKGDSAPREVHDTFPEPVFAFDEVETLARALPFRKGLTVVAPLFSEADEKVEHDTFTVVGTMKSTAAEPVWVIEFADPAIVTRYFVGTRTRRILNAETKQRQGGAILRYVPIG
ncbi:MAG TPA: hypothetical protein VGM20_06300 [Gemmatimonadales bacterium]|jgi:hypothetical protein